MVNRLRLVIWPEKARKQLQRAYLYIKKDSVQNAEKVRKEILEATRNLPPNPERFPADKYKKDNDGTFRAFELHRYRIAYQITDDEIIIVRIRHTSMKP